MIEINSVMVKKSNVIMNSNMLRADCNTIELRFESDTDFMLLKFAVDFIRNNPISSTSKLKLLMPYMPYSYGDKKDENSLYMLKSITDFINKLYFDVVEIWEPHSSLTALLLNRVNVKWVTQKLVEKATLDILDLYGTSWVTTHKTYNDYSDSFTIEGFHRLANEGGVYIVYPDESAEERYIDQIGYGKIINCSRVIDPNTGKLLRVKINKPFSNVYLNFAIIADDAYQSSKKFIDLAEQLKEIGFKDIRLCITHYESNLNKDKLLSSGLFKKIYTTNSRLNLETTDDHWCHNINGTELSITGGF